VRPDDGGGGVVLIDPQSLRRSASQLKGIAGELRALSGGGVESVLPTMPASVASAVETALAALAETTTQVPTVTDSASTELVRRAFWAEYADRIMAGYALSGSAKQEFVNYLRDGTLLRYATPDEAAAAGRELALVTGDFRKDQTQLFMLAAALQGAEHGSGGENLKAFCGGFVQQFGAKNMLLMPRVIQAMEWSRAIAFGNPQDQRVLQDVAREWTDTQLKTDPVKELLAPFSVALANATLSGRLTRTTEDEIADDPDEFAVAALVSQGNRFDTEFLLRCFKNGVVQKIADDSRYYSMRNISGETPPVDPYAIGRMYSEGHGGLPVDTKQIFLDALARNPDAAAQALRPGSLDNVQVFDRFGNATTITDPVTLIYQYGHFDDHGTSLGHAYTAATNYLTDQGDTTDRIQGSTLTQNAVTQMLANDNGDMSSFKSAIAGDLVRNHVGELFDGAYRPDSLGINVVTGASTGTQHTGALVMGTQDVQQIIQHLAGSSDALQTFLHGSAAYQAAVIDHNTETLSGNDPVWVSKIASFDASVLNATDLHNVDQFDAAQERHQLVLDFFKEAANGVVAIGDPIADAALHTGIGATIDHAFPGPDVHDVVAKNYDAKLAIGSSLRASIAAGYYKHGLITTPPPSSIVTGGNQLVSYGGLDHDPIAKSQFDDWMGSQPVVDVAGHAYDAAQNSFDALGIDIFR
jgi:hypothetical protein